MICSVEVGLAKQMRWRKEPCVCGARLWKAMWSLGQGRCSKPGPSGTKRVHNPCQLNKQLCVQVSSSGTLEQ